MTDLVNVLSKLVDAQGNILIPGLMDLVAPLTEESRAAKDTTVQILSGARNADGIVVAAAQTVGEAGLPRVTS
jgi:hypothetical protein